MVSQNDRRILSGRRVTAVALGVVLAIFVAHASYFFHYVNDDAYITFRYSRSLAEGRGPYFNPGEHVEGYTNFLQMVLAAGVIKIAGPDVAPTAMKALGVLWGALAVALAFGLVYRLLAEPSNDPAWPTVGGAVAGGLVAVAPGFALNSTSGLETTLFAMAVTAGVYLGIFRPATGGWIGPAVAFSVVTLTRPEGALVFALYWIARSATLRPGWVAMIADLAKRGRRAVDDHPGFFRELLPEGLAVAAVFVGHLILRAYLYDGHWLPNTYHAKAGGFWGFGSWSYIAGGVLSSLGGWIGVACAAVGLTLPNRVVRAALPVLVVGVGGALLPLVTGPDWMMGWRLVVPYLPLLAVATAIGWCRLAARVAGRPSWLAPALVGAAVIAVAALQADTREVLHDRSVVRARGYARGHEALARWLCDDGAHAGDSVALMDIGIIGYRCPGVRILDITGLTDRHIAMSSGRFLDKQYDLSYVMDREPEFIVMTLTADGEPRRPPPAYLPVRPWTAIEANLGRRPEFVRYYVHRDQPPGPDADWTDVLAYTYGAVQLFDHDYPGQYYLLAVFRRHDP